MTYTNTILIVDDEPSARDILEAFLYPAGYTLYFASNGMEALGLAEEIAPDLILLDVMMPDMDGFQVCTALRQHARLAEIHIIMVTALDDRDSRLRGLTAGADEFISKPFDAAELEARVRTVMQLSRYRRLLAERTKFEWMVEQADDGYVLVDETGHILYANPQARLYFGVASGGVGDAVDASPEPITETFLTLVKRTYALNPPGAWSNWPVPLSEDAPSPRYLVRPESPVSNVLWLQVSLIETASAGSEKYLVRLKDVTDRIMTRNRMWTFDTQVGHKLKTPLAQLTGYLELVKYDVDSLSKDEIKADLLEAHASAIRLQDQIMGIFQYLEALTPPLPGYDRCSLDDLLTIVAEIAAELALDAVAVTQTCALDRSAVLLLSTYATRLIVWEILENARKFHPQHTPTIDVDVSSVLGGISLRVSDDGIHLMQEQLSQIWLPYYQVEQRFTGEVPGMGLGLAVVSSLVWSVGGLCAAHNRQDKPGLVIEIIVPLAYE